MEFKYIRVLLTGFLIGFLFSIFLFFETENFTPEIQNSYQNSNSENRVLNKVSLMVDFQDGRLIYCSKEVDDGKTVFDLLEICSKDPENPFELKYKIYSEIGIFIEQIGDKIMNRGSYWQYWVNNRYSQTGASSRQLKNNDVIEWKFIKGQF